MGRPKASLGFIGTVNVPPDLIGDWWQPFSTRDEVVVVHVDLACDAANEQHAWAWLDALERHRAGRFQHDGARRRYVLCRAALRSLLCSSLSCRNQQLAFGAAEHGKPFAVVDGERATIGFNVSHSGRQGLIALAPEGQVGIDVEERLPLGNLDLLAAAVLGPNERAEVMAASGTEKLRLFLDVWTMKEALTKAHGMGLSMDASGFEISPQLRRGSDSEVFRFPNMPDVTWRLDNLGTDRFAAALAHTADTRRW